MVTPLGDHLNLSFTGTYLKWTNFIFIA